MEKHIQMTVSNSAQLVNLDLLKTKTLLLVPNVVLLLSQQGRGDLVLSLDSLVLEALLIDVVNVDISGNQEGK